MVTLLCKICNFVSRRRVWQWAEQTQVFHPGPGATVCPSMQGVPKYSYAKRIPPEESAAGVDGHEVNFNLKASKKALKIIRPLSGQNMGTFGPTCNPPPPFIGLCREPAEAAAAGAQGGAAQVLQRPGNRTAGATAGAAARAPGDAAQAPATHVA